MRRIRILSRILRAVTLAGLSSGAIAAPHGLELERVVILMRHGVRAPLSGEVPADTRTATAWPNWTVSEGRLTPHGASALILLARHDRRWLAPLGLAGCPAPGAVRIWTNTAERTIASGEAYAQGLAPGCDVRVGHLPGDRTDPIFEPLSAGATAFDPRQAIASIMRYTGGMDALVARHRPAIALLDRVLSCKDGACSPDSPAMLTPSADGRGIDLSGPIRATSGIAQVLLLQEAEGLPRAAVGWGRADPATIERLGALHAALFDVFTRSPYMAAHQASALGHRIVETLTAPTAPRLDVMVGHDTNVTALAAALGVDLDAPGFARNDVAPGGALVIERLRDRTSHARYVRVFYRVQSLAAIRALRPAVVVTPIAIPGCTSLCPLDRFVARLGSRIAALRP
ncbi:glucose-1-phosphatase [Sphingomonas sp. Leaf34]|uniref:histidine-type phosphatase n=1 Tax=Sphingomonas sp. Leaf34 TaxID=1736216 RepID=UPI0006FBE941|nr:histidine-type phosphatase [Sphingomonas sp. Leaf34]KQN30335.1 glucose-1-phosphatase [Sphingomonas sp. Leaf34]